jgi:hypothetical protein
MEMRRKLLQAVTCLACALVAQRDPFGLEGTAFGGGRITDTLLILLDIGSLLFVVALLLTLVRPRVAAVLAIAAALLCLPLYLYLTAPGPFRRLFRGDYAVPLHADFIWDNWAVLGMLTLTVATCLCLWNLVTGKR